MPKPDGYVPEPPPLENELRYECGCVCPGHRLSCRLPWILLLSVFGFWIAGVLTATLLGIPWS